MTTTAPSCCRNNHIVSDRAAKDRKATGCQHHDNAGKVVSCHQKCHDTPLSATCLPGGSTPLPALTLNDQLQTTCKQDSQMIYHLNHQCCLTAHLPPSLSTQTCIRWCITFSRMPISKPSRRVSRPALWQCQQHEIKARHGNNKQHLLTVTQC
jgi:hypothetical protein